jgi:integrase
MIINTGCNLSEILGLAVNDIYIDNFQSFVFIRTNERRTIKNIHKVRSIPLTGISLWGGKKIASLLQKNNGFLMDYKITNIENSINKIIKIFSSLGSLRSFKNRLISKLKEVQCPEEIILELVGRSKKNSLYNRQISLDEKKSWLEQLTYINH